MRSRALRVAILVFQAVWLNAILPGHTRGIVTLPGAADDCASCASVAPQAAGGCCATEGGDGRAPREKDPVPPGRAGRCAICHFAARLTPPPVVDLRPPALEPAAVRPAHLSLRCVALRFPPPYDACGPPAAV